MTSTLTRKTKGEAAGQEYSDLIGAQPRPLNVNHKLQALLSDKNFEMIFDDPDADSMEQKALNFDALLKQLKELSPQARGGSSGLNAASTKPTAVTSEDADPTCEDARKGAKKPKKKKTKSNASIQKSDADDDVLEEFKALALQDNQRIEEYSEGRRQRVEDFKELQRENGSLLSGHEGASISQESMEVIGDMTSSLGGLGVATTVTFCALAMFMQLFFKAYPKECPQSFTNNNRTMVVTQTIRKTAAQIVETLLKVVLQSELVARKSLLDDFSTEDDRNYLRSAEVGPCNPTSTLFDQSYVDFRAKTFLHEMIWDQTYCVRNSTEVKKLWQDDTERGCIAQALLQGFWNEMSQNLKAELAN